MGIEKYRTTLGLVLVLVLVAQSPLLADEKRPVPDYDGRPERTTAGDALLWIPRVVL